MRRWTVGGTAAMLIAARAAGAQESASAAASAHIDWGRRGVRLEGARVRLPLDWNRPGGVLWWRRRAAVH